MLFVGFRGTRREIARFRPELLDRELVLPAANEPFAEQHDTS
jgi:hypothetical protein